MTQKKKTQKRITGSPTEIQISDLFGPAPASHPPWQTRGGREEIRCPLMPLSLPCVCAEQAGSKIDKKLSLQTDEHDYSGTKQEGVESPWELLGWSFSCIFLVFLWNFYFGLCRGYNTYPRSIYPAYRSKVPKVCMFKFEKILTYFQSCCVLYVPHVCELPRTCSSPQSEFAIRGSCDNPGR